IAVVFGILDAIAEQSDMFGDNTESLLMAAGLNEIQTLGFAMGATHSETFTSIAGVGDLEVTCRSAYGRNRRFGRDIINNNILEPFSKLDNLIERIAEVGYLPEGAVACKYIQELSEKLHIKLPICNGLYRILNKEIKPLDFLIQILR
ncbi:MAG: NAD(P)H-dependent glycerol-3-phosphate dehydrogenase, partial [Spirochaetales bacterium]